MKISNRQVQYLVGVLFAPGTNLDEIKHILSEHFGPLGEASPLFPFECTHYYDDEMGQGLSRVFFPFQKRDLPEKLPQYKKLSIELEEKYFARNQKRFVNLDPGYLDSTKLILASTKVGGHKIAISEDIYADMILDFYKGSFRSFEWTFPDFKSGTYFEFLAKVRKDYLKK